MGSGNNGVSHFPISSTTTCSPPLKGGKGKGIGFDKTSSIYG